MFWELHSDCCSFMTEFSLQIQHNLPPTPLHSPSPTCSLLLLHRTSKECQLGSLGFSAIDRPTQAGHGTGKWSEWGAAVANTGKFLLKNTLLTLAFRSLKCISCQCSSH